MASINFIDCLRDRSGGDEMEGRKGRGKVSRPTFQNVPVPLVITMPAADTNSNCNRQYSQRCVIHNLLRELSEKLLLTNVSKQTPVMWLDRPVPVKLDWQHQLTSSEPVASPC